MDPSQAVIYPTEFLNSLEHTGISPHKLELKIGVPIMILRNLDPPPQLSNDTRLCAKNLYSQLTEATILTGCAKGKDIFVPRIPLIPTDLPFDFKMKQFPVRLVFAMSINKPQGHSLKIEGIHQRNPCFSHGQIYIAYSSVGHLTNLHILAPGAKTRNIVHPTALQ
jgi:ATP-dependent DNA helicase PIF1